MLTPPAGTVLTPPVGTVLPSHDPARSGCGDVAEGLRMRLRVTGPSTVGTELVLADQHQGTRALRARARAAGLEHLCARTRGP